MQEKIINLIEDVEQNFFIESIYGFKTKQGIVQIDWDGKKIQLSILQAKKIAYMILEAAQGAALDEAVFEFFCSLPGDDSVAMAATILQAIRQKQGRNDPRFFED